MKNFNDATHQISVLKGESMAIQNLLWAVIRCLPAETNEAVKAMLMQEFELARVALKNGKVDGIVIRSFESTAQNMIARMSQLTG